MKSTKRKLKNREFFCQQKKKKLGSLHSRIRVPSRPLWNLMVIDFQGGKMRTEHFGIHTFYAKTNQRTKGTRMN